MWYIANEALGQIETLTQGHPEIGYELVGARFKVTNGADTDLSNDRFEIDPGHWEKSKPAAPVDVTTLKIKTQRGNGKVRVVQYENGHWQLLVDGRPMMVRGITYSPTPIGQHITTYGNRWMFEDTNGNGKPDMPYDTWVDANGNGKQDADEPTVGDFELMRRMGVNAIRLYRSDSGADYNPDEFNKESPARPARSLRHLGDPQRHAGRLHRGVRRGVGRRDRLHRSGPARSNAADHHRVRVNDHKAESYVLSDGSWETRT